MYKSFYIVVVGLIFYLNASSFDTKSETHSNSYNNWLKIRFDNWEHSLHDLLVLIEQKQSQLELKSQYREVQSDFRKIQFLIEHISEESVKKYINGAPLLSVEPSIPTVNVLEPRGLQVLDELIYADVMDILEIQKVTNELALAVKNLKPIFLSAVLSEADIKRALYKDIVRIYTLQITGFDTPGSLSGLQNAIHNLQGIHEFLNTFYQQNPFAKSLIPLLDTSADYLKLHQDFDTFDRAYFYKNHIANILKVLSSWDTDETTILSRNPSEKWGVNFNSEHIFTTSLFNLDYYTLQPTTLMTNPKVIQLGKKLFYAPILSHDNTMSCATCHQPDKAFTDGLATSITNKEGLFGSRNTPTLINSIYTKGYFYDLREDDPSRQIVHVVKDKNEFNSDFMDIIDRLEMQESYKTAFHEVFPDAKISKYSITAAITAYVASLSSFDSPFDQYMREEINNIDTTVIRGFNLFSGKAACATCHFIPTFSGLVPASFKESESEVLGVPKIWNPNGTMHLDTDLGRARSGKPKDDTPHLMYSFKTTTLRNIAKTSPYMHNGAFHTLNDVMQFYNKGGGAGLGFAIEYQTLSSTPLDLTDGEISDIISFMEALTDEMH